MAEKEYKYVYGIVKTTLNNQSPIEYVMKYKF